MTTDLIFTIIIVVTVIIVIFSIGYFIWFEIHWNKLQRKREEIMRIQQRQWEILMKSLSKKNKEDV